MPRADPPIAAASPPRGGSSVIPPRAPPPLRPLPRTRDRHLLRLRWALLLAALIEFSPVLWSVLSHWHLSTRPPERPPMMVVLAPPPAAQAAPPMAAPPLPTADPPPPEPPPPHVEPLPVAEPPPLPKARRAVPRPTVRPTPPPEAAPPTEPPPQPSAAPQPPPAPAAAAAAEPQEGAPDGKPSLQPSPIYPRGALHDGIEGHVLVRFFVTETGAVADVKVIESSPAEVFDRSVLRAASRYKFEPTGTAYQVERDFIFRLKANKAE